MGDRNGGMVGDHPQPVEAAVADGNSTENPEYAQHRAVVNERLTGESLDAFVADPGGIDDPLGNQGQVGRFDGLARQGDSANLADADRESAKATIEPRQVRSR